MRAWFVPRALSAGYPVEVAEQVWTVLAAFGSFGFCKAHAAAFALPTYQSAWLKTHHPAAFLAGVLTHDPGMYPKRLILDDARNFGIRVLGLDVNASADTYRVELLEPGTAGAEGEGEGSGWRRPEWMPISMRDAVPLRHPAGAGRREGHLRRRGRPDRGGPALPLAVGLLVPVVGVAAGGRAAGAGRRFRLPLRLRGARPRGRPARPPPRKQVTRRDLLLQIGELDRWSRSGARANSSGQLSLDLMGLGSESEARGEVGRSGLELPAGPSWAASSGLPEFTDAELVRAELEVLGLDASRHVIDFYRPFLAALGAVPAGSCSAAAAGRRCWSPGSRSPPRPRRSGRAAGWCS